MARTPKATRRFTSPAFVATTEEEITDVKRQNAFHGATPAYKPVLAPSKNLLKSA